MSCLDTARGSSLSPAAIPEEARLVFRIAVFNPRDGRCSRFEAFEACCYMLAAGMGELSKGEGLAGMTSTALWCVRYGIEIVVGVLADLEWNEQCL
jgi:hypothetical protein